MTSTGSNRMNKTYSVEAWAAVLESLVSEALRKKKRTGFTPINTTLANPYVYILQLELMKCHLSLSLPAYAGKTQDIPT